MHDEDDPCLGEPICLDCYDHAGAVIWNNALGELWRRTVPVYLPRTLAHLTDMTQQRLREQVRIAYAKVAEYQRRGLVHLHAVIRLDRAMPEYRAGEIRPPDGRFTVELLEEAIRATVDVVSAPLPDELGGGRVSGATSWTFARSIRTRGARSRAIWPSTPPRAPNRPAASCTR